MQSIFTIFFFAGATRVFFSFIDTIDRYHRRKLRYTARVNIRRNFYHKMQALKMRQLENTDMQNKIKRAREWMYDCEYIFQETMSLVSYIIAILVAGYVTFKINPLLILVLIIYSFFSSIPVRYFNKKETQWDIDHLEMTRKRESCVDDLLSPSMAFEIKLNQTLTFLDKKIDAFNKTYYGGMLGIMRKGESVKLVSFIFNIGILLWAFWIVIQKALTKQIQAGDIIFQTSAVANLVSRTTQGLTAITEIHSIVLNMGDLYEFFQIKIPDETHKKSLPLLKTPPTIEFKNVTFKYQSAQNPIYQNLNITIKPGEKIAIVGRNGAGKTTLVKLIAGFYEITNGQILIDNINLNAIKSDDWHKNIGLLFQEYNFHPQFTALENIQIGRPDQPLDVEKIIDASISADADQFIQEYPLKYEQLMGESYENGIKPSTGQKQKIAIARFFYRDAPVAIFDEPTSAIDAVSEYKIFNRIYKFFRNKTVIIVSHRFSTVRNADRIIVIDNGQIIEQGTHQELLALNGHYAHSFNLQAEGYR